MTFMDLDRTALDKALTEVHFSYGANLAEGPARRLIETYLAATALSQAEGSQWDGATIAALQNAHDILYRKCFNKEADAIIEVLRALPTRPREQEGGEAPTRDEVLAAVLHEFGPDGCSKILARLPDAKVYVSALRKKAHPAPLPADGWNYDMAAALHDGSEVCCLAPEFAGPIMLHYARNRDAWVDWDGDTYNPTHWFALPPEPAPTPPASTGGHPLPAASFQAGAEAMREAAADICQRWLDNFSDGDIQYVSATEYATGAMLDVKDAILRASAPIPPASSEGR